MSFKVKLISLLGGALVVTIFFAVVILSSENDVQKIAPAPAGKLPIATEPFSNAFINQNDSLLISQNENEKTTSPNLVLPPDTSGTHSIISPDLSTGSDPGDTFITFENLQNLVSTFSPVVVPEKQKLNLPAVLDDELKIVDNGASDFGELMDAYIDKSLNITFPYTEYDKILKSENGIPLSPESLVEKAIAENNFLQIQESALITKKFLEYKIGEVRSVAVRGGAVEINKLVIGFDRLTIELLDKAGLVANGELKKADFQDFYDHYNKTAIFYNQELNQKYGVASLFNEKKGVGMRLAELLGLGKLAKAFLLLPFGGVIGTITPCVCNLGSLITVGPPVGGSFFISFFSSRIFAFFKPLPESWILGDYSAFLIPCLQPAIPVCFYSDHAQGLVIIAGTSL